MYGDFIITSLGSKHSLSYEELLPHSGHAQLKQKQKNQRRRGVVGRATHHLPAWSIFLLSLGNTCYLGYIIR